MKTILAISVLSLGIFASHGSMACNLNDYSCNPFDLGPMPNIKMEKPLRLERKLAPAVIAPRRETDLQWCKSYFDGKKGSMKPRTNRYCLKVLQTQRR